MIEEAESGLAEIREKNAELAAGTDVERDPAPNQDIRGYR